MIALSSLWLPILLSAVFVFVVSSIIHMALPWHKGDLQRLPDEAKVADALRPLAIPPGNYVTPHCESMAEMKSPEFAAKMERGPVMFLTVRPNGVTKMGRSLVLWFLLSLVISVLAALICTRAAPVGASFHRVFGFAGLAAFLGYAGSQAQESIWWSRSWAMAIKNIIDGAIYAAVIGATLAWLWPK